MPLLSVLIAALLAATAVSRPVTLPPAQADSLRKEIEKDREDTRVWLREGATSYLATVQRVDFLNRTTLTVGRAAGNDVRVDDPELAPRHLRVTVNGDLFDVHAVDDTAHFIMGGLTVREAHMAPGSIRVGRFLLRLSHQRYPAIIVFDPRSPRFAAYKGIPYYPVDLAYRFVLPLTPNPNPDTTVIQSTRANLRRAVRVGWFDFVLGGKRCRLEASRLLEPGVGENDIGVFFRDATTGRDTYAVGRYLDPAPLGDGRYVLDFNRAYSPACAYSDHYNCPIPPRANRLPVAVRAGEKDPHYLDH